MIVSAGGRSKILGVQALVEGLNLPPPGPLNLDRVKVYAKYWGCKIIPLFYSISAVPAYVFLIL